MNRINKIEELSISEIIELLQILLEKEGYEKIERKSNDFLEAQIKRGFNSTQTGFIIIGSGLSGKVENQERFVKRLENFIAKKVLQDLVVVSNKTISAGFKNKLNQSYSLNIAFLDRDFLIEKIEENFPHYWVQNDVELMEYESYYLKNVAKDNELKSLRGFTEKAQKLVDIYIKPRIYKIEEDKESENPRLVKYEESEVLNADSPSIIVGDAGAGKTTFLKKLGEMCILNENHKSKLPIFISTIDLIESHYDIERAIDKNLNGFYEGNWKNIDNSYNLILLVDSIDEFESTKQKEILKSLEKLNKQFAIKYFLATRSLESNIFEMNCERLEYYQIEKFNTKQIKAFVTKFFQSANRSQELIDALSENRILERLPMTPLSISLISILFEEKNLEIPATISDIYDNFNLLLLGKSTVNKRFDFVDINFKERILSLYALEILERENKVPMTHTEFLDYFKNYFSTKSQPIPEGKIEEFLDVFISNTGVLYLKDKKYVQFKHDSFMEYYAALEIFKHKRNLEQNLVDNFFDLNWQNTAIFFAGKSKDMPDFLEKILMKVENGQDIFEFNSGVMGLGYLLQALYQTDNNIRERGVIVALAKSIEALDVYKKIGSDREIIPFKDLKLPIITMLNLFFFIENFKSVTLKEPLKMAFNKVYNSFLKNSENITLGYKALKLAIVLNSKRIGSEQELQKLIMESDILNKPLLLLLSEFSINLFDGNNDKILKREIEKSLKKYDDINKKLLELPVNSLRFTALDQIYPDKKIKIFTEGKTDAEIIEQAFVVLTKGQQPYWSLRSAGDKSGGATELRFLLDKSIPVFDEDEIAIGLFDNDHKGIEQFMGLKKESYDYYEGSKRLKRHSEKKIYAMKLPIPKFRENYIQEAPEHNYFAIEHYFSDSILNDNEMLDSTPIPDVYKITSSSSKKSRFSSFVRTQHSPTLFKEFILLFKEIDRLTGVKIEYIEE